MNEYECNISVYNLGKNSHANWCYIVLDIYINCQPTPFKNIF